MNDIVTDISMRLLERAVIYINNIVIDITM